MPFEAESYNRLLVAIASELARPPQSVFPGFPSAVIPIVERALAKKPDQRYQSATELLTALSALDGFDRRARALAELEVGDTVPEALYEAVAEILREIWESQESEAGEPSEARAGDRESE